MLIVSYVLHVCRLFGGDVRFVLPIPHSFPSQCEVELACDSFGLSRAEFLYVLHIVSLLLWLFQSRVWQLWIQIADYCFSKIVTDFAPSSNTTTMPMPAAQTRFLASAEQFRDMAICVRILWRSLDDVFVPGFNAASVLRQALVEFDDAAGTAAAAAVDFMLAPPPQGVAAANFSSRPGPIVCSRAHG